VAGETVLVLLHQQAYFPGIGFYFGQLPALLFGFLLNGLAVDLDCHILAHGLLLCRSELASPSLWEPRALDTLQPEEPENAMLSSSWFPR